MEQILDMRLQGRRALITGAAGGVGLSTARLLASLGCDLALVDLPSCILRLGNDPSMAALGARVELYGCDLENERERSALIAQLSASRGLDILVNNAAFVGTSGLTGWAVPLAEQSLETWRRALEVNLTAAFHLSQGLASTLAKSGQGSIINVGSIYGHLGPDLSLYAGTSMGNPAAYAASKGGLAQLTRWMATVLGPTIRVNCVSPGGIEREQPQVFRDRYVARTPLRRMATEVDVARAIIFFSTNLSSYISGQTLAIDGGFSAW